MNRTKDFLRLADAERWAEALPIIEQIVAAAPHISTSWRNYGVCLFELRRFAEASEKFVRAFELKPDDFGALYRAFLSLFNANDDAAFLALARQQCAREPSLVDLLVEDATFARWFEKWEFRQLRRDLTRK